MERLMAAAQMVSALSQQGDEVWVGTAYALPPTASSTG